MPPSRGLGAFLAIPDARRSCHLRASPAVFDNGAPTANRRLSCVLNGSPATWPGCSQRSTDSTPPVLWFASHIRVKQASGTSVDFIITLSSGPIFCTPTQFEKNQKTSPLVAYLLRLFTATAFLFIILFYLIFAPPVGHPSDPRSLQEARLYRRSCLLPPRNLASSLHTSLTLSTACASLLISGYPFHALQQAR